jgi:prolyl-tRNA synthetase
MNIKNKLSALRPLIIHFTGLKIKESEKKLTDRLSKLFLDIRKEIGPDEINKKSEVLQVRDMFSANGMSPSKFKPSSEKLVRRVIKGEEIPLVNNLVDINNYLSLKYLVPVGVSKANILDFSSVEIRLGETKEKYEGVAGKEVDADKKIVVSDKKGIFTAPTEESQKTAIDSNTKEALMILYFPSSTDESTIKEAQKDALNLVNEFCLGGSVDIRILDPGDGIKSDINKHADKQKLTNDRFITPQCEDFPQWYQDVVREAGLAEHSEVRGCGVVKPYGMKMWEYIKSELGRRITEDGVEDVYFPIFVPIENLEAEKDHVEGFAPELAVVTHGGGEELVNKLAVRPTSEAAMYKTYSKWIQSYKDLPLRLNQWNNVVRWEKRPRAFLRWSEFLWQEGHTAFATEKEAREEVWHMLDTYKQVYEDFLCIPVIEGRKSDMEKFAGAVMTTTVEAMAKDGKAIQGGTSHYLGTNFAKVFGINYLDSENQLLPVHQNSWGFSWRSIGALIMAHGDDKGLRLPPGVAPVQIVLVPIFRDDNRGKIMEYAQKIKSQLNGFRIKIDDREDLTPGFKFNDWELKGVPLRLEIGTREVEEKTITVYRRDSDSKEIMFIGNLNDKYINKIFDQIKKNLFKQAQDFQKSHIYRIESLDDIEGQVGFFEASWSETTESEKLLKEKSGMVSRVLPLYNENKAPKNPKCFITGEEAKHDWLFARSY